MRLWHYKLLPTLDDFHIIAQYRELLAIKGAIDKNGTPNHRLVNKVLDYSIAEFKYYFYLVVYQLKARNIKFNNKKVLEVSNWESDKFARTEWKDDLPPFIGWHTNRYLTQCYYNLEEKYDCGIVSDSAFEKIEEVCEDVLFE